MRMSIALAAGLMSTVALAQTTSDRLLWSFQTPNPANRQFITLADDGTIYTADRDATYALSPAGDLEWSTSLALGGYPIALGDDGTLYTGVGSGAIIVALNPDGSFKWSFAPPALQDLAAGPGVGPDGNVYAFQENADSGGLGAFSLDADGNLRWSTDGDPPVQPVTSLSNSEIAFGADRLHAGVVGLRSGGNPTVYTLDLDGDQLWTSRDFDVHTTDFPVTDADNRVILPWGQTGIRALAPDGQEQWVSIHPAGVSVILRPAVGASGTIYTGDYLGVELWAINPDGTTRWVAPRSSSSVQVLGVSPDERTIVALGGGGFGEDGWVRGYRTTDGTELWSVDLAPESGFVQLATSYRPVFSPDSGTVYLTTSFAGSGVDHGYVIALDITDGTCRADLDGDGELTIFDFLAFQNLFDAGSSRANFDGDGDLTIFDFLEFQNEFDAGCS